MKNTSENEEKWTVSLDVKIFYIILIVIALVFVGMFACARIQPKQELKRAHEIVEKEKETLLDLSDRLLKSGVGDYNVENSEGYYVMKSAGIEPLEIKYHGKWYTFFGDDAKDQRDYAEKLLPELERLYRTYGITGVTIEKGFLTFDLGLSPVLHSSCFYLPEDLMYTEASKRELEFRGYDNIVEEIAQGWYLLAYPE